MNSYQNLMDIVESLPPNVKPTLTKLPPGKANRSGRFSVGARKRQGCSTVSDANPDIGNSVRYQ